MKKVLKCANTNTPKIGEALQTKVINVSDVGRCVRAARKAQGITQKELSSFFTAFSREYLSDLENGKPTVELGKALAVLSTLGLRLLIVSDDDLESGTMT